MDCAFCEQTEIKERTILANDNAFAFLTYTPVVVGHTLICPTRHVLTYGELTPEEKKSIEDLRMKLHSSLSKTFNAEGFNYAWNEGQTAGQEVPHMHLHVLPRKTGDAGVYQYDPREFLYWKRDKISENPQTELLRLTEVIQEFLN